MAKKPLFNDPKLQALYESLGLDQPTPKKGSVVNPYAGGIVNPYATTNMGKIPDFVAADKVAEKTLKAGKRLSPELAKLAAQVEKQKYQAKLLGGKASKDHHRSALERVIDVVSRGNYAVANAVLHGQKAAKKEEDQHHGNLSEVLHGLAAMPGGFTQGLKGKEKTRFHDVLNYDAQRHGDQGNGGIARAAEGLGLDIVLDPLTWAGPGIVGKGIRVAGKAVGKGGKAAQEAEKVLNETRGFNRTWEEEAARYAKTGQVPADRIAQATPVKPHGPANPTDLPDWVATRPASASAESQQAVDDAIAVARESNKPVTITEPAKKLTRAQEVKERSLLLAKAQHEERLLTAKKAAADKAVRDNIIPGKKGVPVLYTREARVWAPMDGAPEHLKNIPYRRLDGVPEAAIEQARSQAYERTAKALFRKTGKKQSRADVEASKEYKDLYKALVTREAEKHGQRVQNAAKKFTDVPQEQFPIAKFDDVHPAIRQMAEDQVRIEFEAKAFRANPVADAKVGHEMIRVPGSKLFDELTPAEQAALMAKEKPKHIRAILKAQKEHGLLDEKFMPVSAEQTAKFVDAEVAKTAAKPATEATKTEDVAAAVESPEAATLNKVEEAAAKPKRKIRNPAKEQTTAEKQASYAERVVTENPELIQKHSAALAEDLATHTAKYGDKGVPPNNAYKLLARRNQIVTDLKNLKNGKFVTSEGLNLRANAILEAAAKASGVTEWLNPKTLEPMDFFGMLHAIDPKDMATITDFQKLVSYDFSKASEAANSAVDSVAKAAVNPEIPANQVVDMVNATKEGVEKAVLESGAPASAAKAAGTEAGKQADAMRVVDEAQGASVDVGKSNAERWGISPAQEQAVIDRIEKQVLAQQEKVYRYLGIRIQMGGHNPILELPLIRIGERGARQAKEAASVTKAAVAATKAQRDYNSLLDAVKATPKAFRIMFDNSYGMGSRVHEVMQTYRGSYASRRAQEAFSISEITKGMKPLDRANAFRHAQEGKPYPVGGAGLDLADTYARYMDHLLDVHNEGSVINLAGLDAKAIQDELKYVRPRPNVDPLKFPEDGVLDWRRMDIPEGLDPNHAAMAVADAVQKAVAMKHAHSNLKALFGVSLTGDKIELAGAKGAGFGKVDHPDLAGYLFPKEIVPQINRMHQVLDELREANLRGVHPVVRLYDLVLGKWKAGVTVYNPAFHLRNMMGDMFMGYLDGVGAKAYSKSARVMAHSLSRRGEELDPWLKTAGGLDRRVVYDRFNPTQVVRSAEDAASELSVITQIGKHSITNEEYMTQYLNRGIRQEIAQSENLAANEVGSQRLTQQLAGKIRNASEKREDFARMAHFIHATERELKRGRPLDEAFSQAAALTKKYHADYNDLTPFEQRVMKRIIPFYTWQRRTMPVLLENMLTKPGKMAVYPKVMSSMSQALGFDPGPGQGTSFPNIEAVVPDWMHTNMMWPMFHHGQNVVYMDPSNPFNDAFKQTLNGIAAGQPVKTFMQQTTPFARVPLELSTGRQFFGAGSGIPIDNKATYLDTQTPLLNILSRISNISPAQTVENARHGDLGLARNPKVPTGGDEAGINNMALLNTLAAAGSAENTQRRQRGELRRRQDISSVDKKKAREDYYKRYGFPLPKGR